MTDPAERTVLIVLDPDDLESTTRTVLHAHAPHHGRLCVHPTPGTAAGTSVVVDVLAALGKPTARLAHEQLSTAPGVWQAAAAWITGERIEQIIILRAHLFTIEQVRELSQMITQCEAHLVLVCHTNTVPWAVEHGLSPRRHQVAGLHEAMVATTPNHIAQNTEAHPTQSYGMSPDEPDLPPLPRSEVAFFRADAHRGLSATDFARVDRAYRHGRDHAGGCLLGHEDYQMAVPPQPARYPYSAGARTTEPYRERLHGAIITTPTAQDQYHPHLFADRPGLLAFLRSLAVAAPTARYALTLLRGAQAGFLLGGLSLTLGLPMIEDWPPAELACGLDTGSLSRIRTRIAHPVRAAALVAALVTSLPPDRLGEVSYADPGGSAALRCDSGAGFEAYPIPQEAESIVRAAAVFQRLRGADPLLSGGYSQEGSILADSAAAAQILLPPQALGAVVRRWTDHVTCHWVGAPLRPRTGGEPDMDWR